jgi:hypothetical protein
MSAAASLLVRSFASLEEASAALDALVAAGLPRERLQISVREDEAGPVAGSFLVGARPEAPYDENFRHPSYRGVYLLTAEGLDAAQRSQADALLARFDSVPVAEVAAAALAHRS